MNSHRLKNPLEEEAGINKITEKGRPANKRYGLWFLKLLITAVLLGFVINVIDISKFISLLQNVHLGYFASAIFLYFLAQLVSVLRLRYYLAHEGMTASNLYMNKLYFAGMFFNTFLPGTITGDGYIAYRLYRRHDIKIGTALRRMLSTRASGLFCLLGYVIIMLFFLPLPSISDMETKLLSWIWDYWNLLLSIAGIVLVIGYIYSALYILKEPFSMQCGALPYSMIVHGLNVLVTVAILAALPDSSLDNWIAYTILFFLAGVASLLPITVGGVGIREIFFVLATAYFAIDVEIGVALSFVFFVVNLLVSLPGLITYWSLDYNPVAVKT